MEQQLLLQKQVPLESELKIIRYNPRDEVICTKDEVERIYRDVTELKEISMELSRILVEQNENIDEIEQNTDIIQVYTESAAKEINKTIEYQKSSLGRTVAKTVIGAGVGVVLFSGLGTLVGAGMIITTVAGVSVGGAVPHLF